MKLLNLEHIHRLNLIRKQAIGFDARLDERLAGLTHEESVFYVAKSQDLTGAPRHLETADIQRFIQLNDRLQAAILIINEIHEISER